MKRFLLFVAIVCLVVFGISLWNQRRPVPESFTPADVSRIAPGELPILAAMDREYTRLAEAVVPSVVSLTTSRKVQQRQTVDPFEFFFGPRRRGAAPREFVQNSLGSGVIVSKEGHIVTNNHVVAQVDEIKVQLRDGREFPARVIGTDESTDIAVLKIEAPGLIPLAFGDSDEVKIGALVLAVGNPFGLQESVTHGMISATGRQISDESGNEFFQTDTAINPGNSGGPLVNLQGEIIGINTAIGNYSGSGAWQGISFAIPANVVRRSLDSILKTGRVVRGYLGVVVQELNPELAQQLGVVGRRGALITGITPGSPAEQAGMKAGDFVIAFNGKPVVSIRDLLRRVSSSPVGSEVQITVIRDRQETTLTARIGEPPTGFRAGPPQPVQPQPGVYYPLAGIEVAPIPANRGNLPEDVHGVIVSKVDPTAPAVGALHVGDVIEEINRQPIRSPEEYAQIVKSIGPNQRILLAIARGNMRSFIVLTPR